MKRFKQHIQENWLQQKASLNKQWTTELKDMYSMRGKIIVSTVRTAKTYETMIYNDQNPSESWTYDRKAYNVPLRDSDCVRTHKDAIESVVSDHPDYEAGKTNIKTF